MTMRVLNTLVAVIAVALFIESLRVMGLDQIVGAVARVGWGLAAILLISGVRDLVRAIAWTLSVEPPQRLPVMTAFRARLAGESLNTLVPMGLIVGEPTKAAEVGGSLAFGAAVRALTIEFAFYSVSLVPLFAAGVVAFTSVGRIRSSAWTTAIAILATIVAVAVTGLMVRRGPVWMSRRRRDRAAILACEAAYQLLAVGETYLTLRLIGAQATIASALVLETVSRAVTMFFKMVPMRIGVDEASSSFVAAHVSLDPVTGLTVALVRKLRMVFWSAAGLALLAWRRAAAARARIVRPQIASASAAALLLALSLPAGASAQEAGAAVAGSVAITGPDGAALVVPGVTVTLRCDGDEPQTDVTNDQGEYHFANLRPRSAGCSIVAELQGFASETSHVALTSGQTTTADMQLKLDTLREEVTVRATPEAADADRSPDRVEQVTSSVMQTAPLAHERFQDALPLIPGVIRGPDGLLNISGLRSNQAALTFNSANGTDPVTGEDAIELPIDAVSSVQVRGAAYAPEFGLSAGAVTLVETHKAGDAWDVTVNDLEPRLRRRGGEFRGIESWTPRVTVGGPLVPGKLQLLESAQYEYSQTRVFGLPPFESDTKLQTFETFTRADWLRSQTDRVTASVLISPRTTTYAGLNTFNPQSVTADIDTHNVLASLSDQIVTGGGVVDARTSVKQFDATIGPSRGLAPMRLAPDVNSGSYFNDQDRTSRRVEGFLSYSFTPIGPAHVVKVGGGVTYETFDGVSVNRPVEVIRADGTISQLFAFVGAGGLDQNKTAVRRFAQDAWSRPSPLSVLYG